MDLNMEIGVNDEEMNQLIPLFKKHGTSLDAFTKFGNDQWNKLLLDLVKEPNLSEEEKNKLIASFPKYSNSFKEFEKDEAFAKDNGWDSFLTSVWISNPSNEKKVFLITLFHKYGKSMDDLKLIDNGERLTLRTELLKKPPNNLAASVQKLSTRLQLLGLLKLALVVR